MSAKTSARFCKHCQDRIIWAVLDTGGWVALNPTPSALGAMWAYPDIDTWMARLNQGDSIHPLEKTYLLHTCSTDPQY